MLIIEIILTIFAWRNGWKWLSLIPVGCALLLGLFMGMAVGASGGDINIAKGLAIFLDVSAIIALIVLVARKPKSTDETPKV